MDQNQKYAFWRDEYLKLQDQYEDFDRRSLTIKGWIAAGSVTAMAIGLDSSKSPYIWIVIALVSACFWYLEANWKMFQYALQSRIRILEAAFRDDPDILWKDPPPFQIFSWWFRAYADREPIYADEKDRPKLSRAQWLRRIALQRFVMLPYVLFILLSIVGFVWRLTHS